MPIDPAEGRRASDQRNADNKARVAFAEFHFKAVNVSGLFQWPKVGDFGLTFVERPTVTHGIYLDLDSAAEVQDVGDDLTALVLPSITPFISDWDQDDRGFYVGAWAAVNVGWPSDYVPDGFTFWVDYLFEGTAMKDVDPEVRS